MEQYEYICVLILGLYLDIFPAIVQPVLYDRWSFIRGINV